MQAETYALDLIAGIVHAASPFAADGGAAQTWRVARSMETGCVRHASGSLLPQQAVYGKGEAVLGLPQLEVTHASAALIRAEQRAV